MMGVQNSPSDQWQRRACQLLARLQKRATDCPGLFPVELSHEFERVAEVLCQLQFGDSHEHWGWQEMTEALEWLDRNPSWSHHAHAIARLKAFTDQTRSGAAYASRQPAVFEIL